MFPVHAKTVPLTI